MQRAGGRGLWALIGVLVSLGFALIQLSAGAEVYRVQVVPEDNSPTTVLTQVQTQIPDAYLTENGGQVVIAAGAFGERANAEGRVAELQRLGLSARLTTDAGSFPSPAPEGVAPSTPSFAGLPFHFPYAIAPASLMESVGGDQSLHRDAAQAFRQMQAQAGGAGINLVPLSGYRNWDVQAFLFRRQIQRRGSEAAALRLSAPPGHSEHHTGYAVDIGDGQNPSTHLQYRFDQTRAFQWLAQHAQEYGFELSFLPNNPQGVSYEPWHWRFVKTPAAQAAFAAARQRGPSAS